LTDFDKTYVNVEAFKTENSFPNEIRKPEYRVRKSGIEGFYYSDYMNFPYNNKNEMIYLKIYTDICLESTWISEYSFVLNKNL